MIRELLTELGHDPCHNLAQFAGLNVDVYSASVGDAIWRQLSGDQRFVASELTADPLGTPLPSGGSCQDLERLTFHDESLDVVITEDVLEHVRYPEAAMGEIKRVLRPGGIHIFTVPINFVQPTLTRVEPREDGADEYVVLPAEFHGDRRHGPVLAYRTFGLTDLINALTDQGFTTELRISSYTEIRQGIVDSYVFVSRKNESA